MTAGCLQLDLGNSAAKWRYCSGETVLSRGQCRLDDAGSMQSLLACTESLQAIWIASVAGPEKESALAATLGERWGVVPWFARTTHETAGLVNSYSDPSRMGVDRWLAMLAARAHYPGRLCVVDAGSALTIDVIRADGCHEGGYIIPGPTLMERALLLDTDRVRFDEDVQYSLVPGQSTAEAVRHGIALSQVGAVSVALERVAGTDAQLVFSGGAGEVLMNLLDVGGHWHPDLVFEGLAVMAAEGR